MEDSSEKYLLMACEKGKELTSSLVQCKWLPYSRWSYTTLQFESKSKKEQLIKSIQDLTTEQMSFAFKKSNFVPKAIFSDVDATLLPVESIELLAESYSCLEVVRNITKKAMEGTEPNFKKALELRLSYLKGLPIKTVQEIALGIEPYHGVKELISWSCKADVPFHMVSGGFVQMLEIFAKRFDVKFFHANCLEVMDGILTGKIVGSCVDGDEKKRWLVERCHELQISPEEVIAIGDGANDLEMLKKSGLSIGFKPKPILYSVLNVINNTEDHCFHNDFIKL